MITAPMLNDETQKERTSFRQGYLAHQEKSKPNHPFNAYSPKEYMHPQHCSAGI